jgi:AcrR family transcriptional regulator
VAILSRRSRERQQRSTARRAEVENRIFAATETLLADGNSFAELGIERLAAEAGISRTAFYDYFDDKRDLLLRLTDRIGSPLLAHVDERRAAEPPAREDAARSIAMALGFARRHAAVWRAVAEARTYDAEVAALHDRLTAGFIDAVTGRIEAQRVAGRPSRPPARAAAAALVWMVAAACYEQLAGETGISDDELVEALTEIWTRAIYADDAPG